MRNDLDCVVDAEGVMGCSVDYMRIELLGVAEARKSLGALSSSYSVKAIFNGLKGAEFWLLGESEDDPDPIMVRASEMHDAIVNAPDLNEGALMACDVVCLFDRHPREKKAKLLQISGYDRALDALVDSKSSTWGDPVEIRQNLGAIRENVWF